MIVKQLSIFVENKSGRFPEILDVLAEANVRILAATVADTTEFGILRMITEDNEKAFDQLTAAKVSVSQSEVFILTTPSFAGSFSQLLKPFSRNGINIEYLYCFAIQQRGYLVLRTNDVKKTKEIILRENISYITAQQLTDL